MHLCSFRYYNSKSSELRIRLNSTFIGIAIHNATATGAEKESTDLAAGVRQDANGLLGTTVQLSDLVSLSCVE